MRRERKRRKWKKEKEKEKERKWAVGCIGRRVGLGLGSGLWAVGFFGCYSAQSSCW
jgi:hypothetical protein